MSSTKPRFFPPPASAGPDGLLAVGGPITEARLCDAYRHGIFPWPTDEGLTLWVSPDPLAVIELDSLHVSRRLRDTLRSGKFAVTFDRNFAGVIRACATVQDRRGRTWITPEMESAYCRLHAAGIAHSVETWCDGRLVGGTYGVAFGGLFAGESMFYRMRDASKVALVHLVERLRRRGYVLFDVQQWTPHTGRLGATTVVRREYLRRVAAAVELDVTFGDEP